MLKNGLSNFISCDFLFHFLCDFLFASLDGKGSAIGLRELLLELIPILKECVHGDDRVAVHLFVLMSFLQKNNKLLWLPVCIALQDGSINEGKTLLVKE